MFAAGARSARQLERQTLMQELYATPPEIVEEIARALGADSAKPTEEAGE